MSKKLIFLVCFVLVLSLAGSAWSAQVLIDDDFNGEGLDIGDAESINGGFTLVTNALGAAESTAVETGSNAEVNTSGPTNSNTGIVSNASFDPLSEAALTGGQTVEPIDIGSRRELFVDDFLIDTLNGARREMHSPQPREVVMQFDRPWESFSPGWVTIIQDDNVLRMYYRATHTPPTYGKPSSTPRRQVTCYAESKDGIRWSRPSLGLIEFDGSKDNNIMWDGVGSHNFSAVKDTNPDCAADARYKAVGRGKPMANEPSPYEHGLYVLKSPDGIHWQPVRDKPVITKGGFDSQNLLFWDSVLGAYRAYWRNRNVRKIPEWRDVRTAVSNDTLTWSKSRMLEYEPGRRGTSDTDGKAHQYYTNGIHPYHRAPHILLGFPMRYIDRGWTASTDQLPELRQRLEVSKQLKRLGTALTDTLLIVSRDGVRFHVWPRAFIRPGIQRCGNWFYSDTGIALGIAETRSSLDETAPNELSFYVRENGRIEAPGQLRRYTIRLDGFASLNASLEGGTALTRPLVFAGHRMEINFATSAGGSLRVGILDEIGNPIPGFSLDDCDLQYGDQIDRVVSWKSKAAVGDLAGTPVRLRIELKDADLYSFQFTDRDAVAE